MAYASFAPRLSTSPVSPPNDVVVQTVTGTVANLLICTGNGRPFRIVRDADGMELDNYGTQAAAVARANEMVARGLV